MPDEATKGKNQQQNEINEAYEIFTFYRLFQIPNANFYT